MLGFAPHRVTLGGPKIEIHATFDFSRLKALILIQDSDFRAAAAEVLRRLGFGTVHEAADAANALAKFREVGADLVLAGFGSDPTDGLEFVRAARTGEDSPNPYVPIVMVAREMDDARSIEARDWGVNDFLVDPLSEDYLSERVVEVIENPKPFVRTDTYFGPDRRLWNLGVRPGARERRKVEDEVVDDVRMSTPDRALPGDAANSSG